MEGKIKKAPLIPSQRVLLAVVLFSVEFFTNQNLMGVGIVCMTVDESSSSNTTSNSTNLTEYQQYHNTWQAGAHRWMIDSAQLESRSSSDVCDGEIIEDDEEVTPTGVFYWSRDLQGVILSAYTYGYMAMMLFSGLVVTRFGPHKMLFIGCVVGSLCMLVSPGAALISPYLLITTEIIKGISLALYFPSTFFLWSTWVPDDERSKIVNYSGLGSNLGSVVCASVHGILCQFVSWDSIFYIYGCLGIAFSTLFYFTTSETPQKHPRISERERDYIEHELANRGLRPKRPAMREVPWKKVFTSRTLWSIALAGAGLSFCGTVKTRLLNVFLEEVLKVPIAKNGILSSLPSIASLFVTIASSALADWLIRRGVKVIVVRKVMWGLGMIPSAIIGCFVGFIDCNQLELSVFVQCLWIGLTGFAHSGAWLTVIEHAPRYSGILLSFISFFGQVPRAFSASVFTAMTPNGTLEEWRKVFFLAAGIEIAAALVYILLAQDGIADWAVGGDEQKNKNIGQETKDSKPEQIYSITITSLTGRILEDP